MFKRKKLIIGIAISIVIGQFAKGWVEKKFSFENQLPVISEEFNKTLPMKIDATTELVSTEVGPDKRLVYNYKLLTFYRDQIDLGDFEENMWDQILQMIQNEEEMKTFRDNDAILVYSYVDKNDEAIMDFEFTPEDYK